MLSDLVDVDRAGSGDVAGDECLLAANVDDFDLARVMQFLELGPLDAQLRRGQPVFLRQGGGERGQQHRGQNQENAPWIHRDRKSTRLNSSHGYISYAVFCL